MVCLGLCYVFGRSVRVVECALSLCVCVCVCVCVPIYDSLTSTFCGCTTNNCKKKMLYPLKPHLFHNKLMAGCRTNIVCTAHASSHRQDHTIRLASSRDCADG